MEANELLLKTVVGETRLEIIKLLLKRSYCTGAIARKLQLSEETVSPQLKSLRKAGLLTGKKRGRLMHYDINRDALRAVAAVFTELADAKFELPEPEDEQCLQSKRRKCHMS